MKNSEANYVSRWRLIVMALLVILAMGCLLVNLWNVQMGDERNVSERIRKQTTVSERLSPARGSILDRNGVPLAENKASFDIDFYLDEMIRDYKQEHHGQIPKIGVRRKQGRRLVDRSEPNVSEIVKEGAEQLSQILGMHSELNPKELQDHYYQSHNIPYQYQTDISFETLSRFSEHTLGVPGIDVAVRPIRFYDYGALAAHILGYVGKPPEKDVVGGEGATYETVGREGIESIFDRQLQGSPGGRVSRIDYKGYVIGPQSYNPPTVGNSLYLTIDARIQYICEQVMRGVGRGAAVVMDPNNGDILAMVSVPSYDPNDFIPKIDPAKFEQIRTDATAPLINRAVAAYAPGSTYKILVAAAALKSGSITPDTIIDCPPSIAIGDHVFHEDNLIGDGPLKLHDALRVSSDVFFYQLGIRTGMGPIDEMGKLVGFGETTGIPVTGEKSGTLPGPEWLKQVYPRDRWQKGYTANAAIGQGFVQTTPLQMAVLVSAIANGGTVYYPRLTIGVSNLAGENVVSVPTRVRSQLGLSTLALQTIQSGLWAVVNEEGGTAHNTVPLADVAIAGKTGTAQHTSRVNGVRVKDTTTWFVSYAPFDKPRYVVVVVVEGGQWGGSTAGPLVHDIYRQIFDMEKTGHNPTIAYLKPAVGNFNGVSEYVPPSATPPPGVLSTGAASVPTATAAPNDAPDAGMPIEPVNENDNGPMTPSTVRRSRNSSHTH